METRTRTGLSNSLSSLDHVDYGYEEHVPAPKSESEVHPEWSGRNYDDSPFETGDATEISQSSPSNNHECWSTVTFDLKEEDYPPMPAERQARKQRSFRRRGGAVHASLLKSAVMASMMEFDDSDDCETGSDTNTGIRNPCRRESCHSSISLQSLQDALRTETSPRKRARRGRRSKSEDNDEDDEDEDDNGNKNNNDVDDDNNVNEASHMFDTMRMSSAQKSVTSSSASSSGARKEPFKREPPARRVSRKTSYDSRVSDFDSEGTSSDDWAE